MLMLVVGHTQGTQETPCICNPPLNKTESVVLIGSHPLKTTL
jgi:hypothetical protein